MSTPKIIASAIGGLVVLIGLGWIFAINDFAMFKFFAPKQEAVRRQTFEESKAYKQGMINELRNYQRDYINGDKDQKAALRTIILRQADQIPADELPSDLRSFIFDLRSSK
jgi:hypothetical protein